MTTCKSCEYSQRQIEKLQKEIESLTKELDLQKALLERESDVSCMYCGCQQSQCYLMNGSYICATCNRPIGK